MKRYQLAAAIACILMGIAGFAGMYAFNQSDKDENENRIPIVENHGNSEVADRSEETESDDTQQVADNQTEATEEPGSEVAVGDVVEEILHFQPEKGLMWPVEGPTLLDFSMDKTIYFPTLNQYQCNPGMVIGGEVNSKVYVIAKGKITSIDTNEVTGCTVTQDIGDGYAAVYGQLKELKVKVGDMVESGQVVGFIGEPTKYFSLEGPNVYFQILKNGVPVDPTTILGN